MYSFIYKTLTRDYLSVSVSYYMKKSYKAWAQAWIWLRSFFNVFFLRSLPEWAWPPGSTRWWRYTRPPRMTSCCACSEASCAPTRTEWVNWWERLWTTSHGQLQRFFFLCLLSRTHLYLCCQPVMHITFRVEVLNTSLQIIAMQVFAPKDDWNDNKRPSAVASVMVS